ncbi:MAG: tetratricopeptide repeat protein, partial [Aristaeellaceae bacterium]
MSKETHGKVVPFALPAYRLRRSADDYRRRGRMEDALVLLRRAAVQEDSAVGWLHLARQLRQMGCYEQAAALLYRQCAREDMLAETWLELGKCQQALGRQEAACDSLYHYLQEDPYSEAAEEAHALLDMLERPEGRSVLRQGLLVRRGLTAFRRGEQAMGLRRIRRAIRLTEEPASLHITLALLALADGRSGDALAELARALKKEPDNVRAMSMLSVALSGMGKPRAALGMLEKCAALATEPAGEDYFLTAAWTLSARGAARRYLTARLKRQPCRIALMHPLASLDWQEGRRADALQRWRRILALDPTDQRAQLLLSWTQEHPGEALPPMGGLPAEAVQQRMTELMAILAAKPPAETMLGWASPMRMTLDWCMTVPDAGVQTAAVRAAGAEDAPCVRAWLRETLTAPGTLPEVRQRVMIRLAEMGDDAPMNVLIGQRMTTAQLTKVDNVPRSQWHLYLPRLLQETRRTCEATELAFFAADLWQVMSPAQRQEA